jgi:type 2 lantibiotic biosynthesis protein LanM
MGCRPPLSDPLHPAGPPFGAELVKHARSPIRSARPAPGRVNLGNDYPCAAPGRAGTVNAVPNSVETLDSPEAVPASPWWTLGLTASERLPGASLPRWADFVERAIEAAPLGVVGAAPGPTAPATTEEAALLALAGPLRTLVETARRRVEHATRNETLSTTVDLPAVVEGWADLLGRRLARIAARTMVWELNSARRQGRLIGSTPQERFASFTGGLAGRGELRSLVTKYPVLARLLAQTCGHSADAFAELLLRFGTDRATIVDTLLGGTDPGRLIAIETGNGDVHQRGRAVATLRFDSGPAVVYKPRSLALHEHFGQLAGWLNTLVAGLDLKTVREVPRAGYGWLEFISQRPCSDFAEIALFYRRQGALLALLYAVDATDIHCENLIACGDQPVLVDIETLFHPVLFSAATAGADPAADALRTSVRRTALLPQMLLGDNGALDISGLGGDKGTVCPGNVVGWEAPGTDTMRLVRRTTTFAGSHNRPRVGAVEVDPAEYQTALLAGFRAGYDAIVAHRAELLAAAGPLARCAADEIRVVARATRLYATLLDESTHPDVLRDALDRERALDVLRAGSTDDPILSRLVEHELDDLWQGDIPLFRSRPDSPDLRAASGAPIAATIGPPGLESAIDKINRMGEVDRYDQEWIITATLATRPGPVEHHGGEPLPGPISPTSPDQQRVLSAACGIADEIVARAVRDHTRANWLGLELIDGKYWSLAPMGAGLAEGYSGVALYLAQLGKLTGASRYTDLARSALQPIPQLLAGLAANPELPAAIGCGGLHGLGGICYALARIGALWDDPEITGWLGTALDLTAATMRPEPAAEAGIEHADVATGLAGGLATMLAVHSMTGLAAAGRLARSAADQLAGHVGHTASRIAEPSGFATGYGGVGWALLRWAATDAGRSHREAGLSALDRDRTSGLGDTVGWCSGLAGTVLAQTQHLDVATPEHALDASVAALTAHPPLRDMSLCHGELGAVEALTVLAARGSASARSAQVRRAGLILGALERGGPRCGTPGGVSSPGLLTGLAGIGYGLLRLGFAREVPSILLFDPAPPRSP